MPENTEIVTEPTAETVVEPIVDETPDHAAEAAKWKALSRKNEERAKENEAAAKRLAEIEEANKSEAEKLLTRAELAEKKLAERDAADAVAALIAEVAKEKGVPQGALRGTTREELEAHAETLHALIPVVPLAPSSDGLGAVGSPIGGVKQITSISTLDSMTPAEVNAARRSGALDGLLGKQT